MILRLRRWLVRAHPVIVAGSLFLVGCHDGATVPDAPEVASAPDGETFFRGILLGQGPLVHELRSLRPMLDLTTLVNDPAILAASRELEQRLVRDIRTADPTYFDRFEDALTSGDHLRIRAALHDARRVVFETSMAWPESRPALERVRSDPELRGEVLRLSRELSPPGDDVDEQQVLAALDEDLVRARIRELTLEGQGGSEEYILAGVVAFVVAGVIHWVAVALNIAAAMNFAVAVNVITPCNVVFNDGCDEFLRVRHDATVHELAERYHRADGDVLVREVSTPSVRLPLPRSGGVVDRHIRRLSGRGGHTDAGRLLPVLVEVQGPTLWIDLVTPHADRSYVPHLNIDFPFSSGHRAPRERLAVLARELVTRYAT